MRHLTPKQGRTLALALLGAALTMVVALLVAPVVVQHHRYEARLQELRDLLSRFTSVARTQNATQTALNHIKQQDAANRYYLRSNDEAFATVEMQEHIGRIVDRSGGQLASTQVLATQGTAHATVISLRVNMRGDVEALQRVVYGLETGRPMLFLENVSIRAGRRAYGGPGRSDSQKTQLEISFEAKGYMRKRVL